MLDISKLLIYRRLFVFPLIRASNGVFVLAMNISCKLSSYHINYFPLFIIWSIHLVWLSVSPRRDIPLLEFLRVYFASDTPFVREFTRRKRNHKISVDAACRPGGNKETHMVLESGFGHVGDFTIKTQLTVELDHFWRRHAVYRATRNPVGASRKGRFFLHVD